MDWFWYIVPVFLVGYMSFMNKIEKPSRVRRAAGYIEIVLMVALLLAVIGGARILMLKYTLNEAVSATERLQGMSEKSAVVEELGKTPEGREALARALVEIKSRAATQPSTQPSKFELEIDGKKYEIKESK